MPGAGLNAAGVLRVLAAPGLEVARRNPYTWLLYSNMPCQVDDFSLRRARRGRYHILHVHYPESDLNAAPTWIQAWWRLRRRFSAIDGLRARGTKVFWTVHNLGSREHHYPRLERWFWRELQGRLDGYIALSESGRSEALKRFPLLHKLPGLVVPHGHYRDAYPDPPGVDARAELGLAGNARVLLFFGRLRPYKNVPLLIDAFRDCPDRDAVLLIAGAPDDRALARELQAKAAGDARVRIDAAHVLPERVHLYFKSADLVVLPYRDFWNSGVAHLGLSFNRPILAPNRGAMGELAALVGTEWMRTFEELTGEELSGAIEWALGRPRAAIAPLAHLDWRVLALRTLEAYQYVLSRRS